MQLPSNESINSSLDARLLSISQEEIERTVPELFEGLEPADKKLALGKLQSLVSAMMIKVEENYHAGPLPSPRTLKDYSKVLPEAPERIIGQFEKQSDHRMEMEKIVVKAQVGQSRTGQIMGYSVALLFLVAAVGLILLDHAVAGTVIGSIDLVALVSVFVFGKIDQGRDLRSK